MSGALDVYGRNLDVADAGGWFLETKESGENKSS